MREAPVPSRGFLYIIHNPENGEDAVTADAASGTADRSIMADDTTPPALVPGIRNTTSIARSELDAVYVHEADLVNDLMGKVSFTDMMLFDMHGKRMPPDHAAVVEAVMVTLMEHGLTPSTISARLIYHSSPDAMQAAVAAGLLGAGSAFLGSMENLASSLQSGVQEIEAGETDAVAWSRAFIARCKSDGTPLPGFGHHIHRPDDPRTERMFTIAAERGVRGAHTALVRTLHAEFVATKGKHVTMNVTGAIAAVLSDLGYPWQVLRGFSLVARSAGIVAHLLEEQRSPLGREIWDLVERATPYQPNPRTDSP